MNCHSLFCNLLQFVVSIFCLSTHLTPNLSQKIKFTHSHIVTSKGMGDNGVIDVHPFKSSWENFHKALHIIVLYANIT